MNELKRLLNKRFMLLLLFVVIVNIGLFVYQQLAGKNFDEISADNRYRQWCIGRYSDLKPEEACMLITADNQILSAYVRQSKKNEKADSTQENVEIDQNSSLLVYYDSLPDSDKENFRHIMAEMEQKLSYVNNFGSEIAQVRANADNMRQFSIFAKKDSFSYNNILKTAADFARLEGLELSLVNDKAVAEFTSYYYTFYIAMALMLLVVYALFAERENGMWQMVHSAGNGRLRLGIVRGAALLVISLAVTAVLYFTVLIISFLMYGGVEEVFTPIQTISEYRYFTYNINKLQYIIYNFLFSWFAIYVLSVMLWMLFNICRKRNYAFVAAGVIFGTEMLLYQKISLQSAYALLKRVNIVRLLNINQIFGTYENLGFGTFVVEEAFLTFMLLFILLLICYAVSVAATIWMRPGQRKTIFGAAADRLQAGYQRIFSQFPVLFKEFHKLFITGKGFAVAAAMIAVTFYFSANGKMAYADSMKERDELYLSQGGRDYSQIEELVNTRLADYENAKMHANEAAEKYLNGEIDQTELYNAKSNSDYYGTRVRAVEEFMTKMDYLDRIEDEYGVTGYLISDRGYECIFGKYSSMRELILVMVLTAAVMIIISESAMLELRTGMHAITRSASRGRDWLFLRKVLAGFLATTLLFVIVYGIDYVQLADYYGMPYLTAPIMSLSFMEGCKLNVTIGEWILLRLLLRFAVAIMTMTAAFVSSRIIGKKGNRAFTILVLAAVLALVVVLNSVGMLL